MNDDPKPDDCRQWWEDYVEIVAAQDGGEEVSTEKVAAFLQLTERLAQAVVNFDLDPTPLNQFRQNAEGCCFGVQERLPAVGEAVHLLLDRLRQKLTSQRRQVAHTSTALTELPVAPESSSPTCPVVLHGENESPVVRGKKKRILTPGQHDVVTALLEAGQDGLNKDELQDNSGHSDARGILDRLRKSDPDWNAVIHMAGRTGGRYRIL